MDFWVVNPPSLWYWISPYVQLKKSTNIFHLGFHTLGPSGLTPSRQCFSATISAFAKEISGMPLVMPLGIWDWLHFTKLWSNSWQGCIAWNAWKYVKRPRYHGVKFFSHIRRPTSWPRDLFFCQNWSRSRGFWRLPGHLRSRRPCNGIHTFV